MHISYILYLIYKIYAKVVFSIELSLYKINSTIILSYLGEIYLNLA
ncbi:hypothetical protein C8J95_104408 [Elizabethkingia sp. YR214]|nr:hypothetical protein C8J95_104408 [Elizabethkingia sp. YR214]